MCNGTGHKYSGIGALGGEKKNFLKELTNFLVKNKKVASTVTGMQRA